MKGAVIFLAILGCALGLPTSVDWSKIKPNDIYIEPINPSVGDIPGGRVIGGTEVTRNSVPYQVAVMPNGNSFCGGSLITSRSVLTAAHCTVSASFVTIIVGAHNVNTAESTQQRASCTTIRNHAQYSSSTLINDISIVICSASFSLNTNVGLVTLAPASSGTFAGSTARLFGWGRTSDSSNAISPTLRLVDLAVITNAVCQQAYGATMVRATTVCTSGGSGNVGACNGDSGGPLTVNGVQIGIVSFGSTRCQAGNPSAFTRVSQYITWINQNTVI